MTARWAEVGGLFERALGVAVADRDAWLDECGEDPVIVDEVRSLLRYDETPASTGIDAGDHVGRSIGAYRLGPLVGSGGMGSVYAAERSDDAYRKRVAVKLVKGGMDSEQILRRFRQERQVLANLEHPGIARLVDGGVTDDGRPYLVMEFVDGEPIDAWCAHHETSIEGRLRLFRQVCDAVQHAHRNLVVHRDIKPGNIVVSDDGTVKLLDFGIAKVLEHDAAEETLTQAGGAPLTPRYASPEQVRGGVITTATDLYALGVLLYELLAGSSPYEFTTHTREEVERLVCETTPLRPSVAVARTTSAGAAARSRRLSGDLDTIVMKAMHKDPARRYATADQLGEDIRRHLAGLIVLARPDTLGYRVACFARRHRIGVTAGVAAALALVAGLVVSTVLFVQARRAEHEAQERLDQVRSFARTMMYDVHDRIETLPGATPVRAFLVRTTLDYLDTIATEAGDDVERHHELGAGYDRMASVQGLDTMGNLGDVDGAIVSGEKALHHWSVAPALAPDDVAVVVGVVSAHRTLGDLRAKRGQADQARMQYETANTIGEAAVAEHPDHPGARRQLYVVRLKLGDLCDERGDADAARSHYVAALTLSAGLMADSPEDLGRDRDHQIALTRLGRFEARHGDRDAAREYLERSLASREASVRRAPDNAQYARDLAIVHEGLGDFELDGGDRAAALEHFEASRAILREQADVDPESVLIRQNLSIAIEKVAGVHLAAERYDEALALFEQSLELTSALADADPSNVRVRFYVGLCYQNLGAAQRGLDRLEEAEASYARMAQICRALLDDDPDAANHFMGFVIGAVNVGELMLERSDADGAITFLVDAERTTRRTLDRHADEVWAVQYHGACCEMLGRAHEERGRDASRAADARLMDFEAAMRWFAFLSEAERGAHLARCRSAIEGMPPD